MHKLREWTRKHLPSPLKRFILWLYWLWYDACDFLVEQTGHLWFHNLRLWIYRHIFNIRIGTHTSLHRRCRFYRPVGVVIGEHTVINRQVLLDGRSGLTIGNNVSISEGAVILTLEHDPNSPTFENRGAPVTIHDRAFIGAQAMILPGVTIGEGAVIAARAVVTHDVAPYTIVAGVPARPIGERSRDLTYTLDYRKFLG
ncbi:MAG TPA: acyltransferase [Anaerolineae bacterium]|nr:acyltransferase [Anaerolineae bacterium]HQI83589.1 acyltransferase [Anaerolineae bacterium]